MDEFSYQEKVKEVFKLIERVPVHISEKVSEVMDQIEDLNHRYNYEPMYS